MKANYTYIMGRGHSGSTVLDAILGNSSDIESVGELISGMGRYSDLCSCGKSFQKCEYWREVRNQFEKETGLTWDKAVKISTRQAHIKKYLKTYINSNKKEHKELTKITKAIINSIQKTSNKNIVLDSSKEITRGLFLSSNIPNAKIIHLVKHPEGELASLYYRIQKGVPFKFLRKKYNPNLPSSMYILLRSFSWIIGNFLAELIRIKNRGKVLRVHYENLSNNPSEELNRISDFLETDLTSLINSIEEKEELRIGHNIGGNKMRFEESFVFEPSRGNRRLPLRYKLINGIITWPLMFFYGYNIIKRNY